MTNDRLFMYHLSTVDPNGRECFAWQAWVLGLLRPSSTANRFAAHLVCRMRSPSWSALKRDATQSAQSCTSTVQNVGTSVHRMGVVPTIHQAAQTLPHCHAAWTLLTNKGQDNELLPRSGSGIHLITPLACCMPMRSLNRALPYPFCLIRSKTLPARHPVPRPPNPFGAPPRAAA